MANVRDTYTIRTSLEEGMMDLVINPTNESGTFRLKREITVRTLIWSILAVIFYFYLVLQSPLANGGILGIILWSSGYLWLVYLLIAPTPEKLPGYSYVKPMFRYLNKGNRQIPTRMASPSNVPSQIVGLKGIRRDGAIVFNNNDVGEIVELTGNASILMFDSDKIHVINSVGNFYRNIRPDVNLIYDNVSAPQRVQTQVAAKKQQALNLINNKSNLMDVIKTQQRVLQNWVGKSFKGLHQYVIVRTTNDDELSAFNEWLKVQIGSNDADSYLRDYRVINNPNEVRKYLKGIYTESDLESEVAD